MGGIIIIGILIVIVIGLFIILLPILIPVMIVGFFQNRFFLKEYKTYLKSINGKKIFVYNSRTNSYSYIRENILPKLSDDIEIVYLNGRKPISNLNEKYISHALYRIKDKKGFPYLLKVEDEEIVDKSINNIFYNTKNQNKNIQLLFDQINQFYEKD